MGSGRRRIQWTGLSGGGCPLSRCLSVMGDRWTLLILRQAFRGERRFEEIRASLGISPTLLNQRLKVLSVHGIFERRVDPAKPKRPEYHLTAKGIELAQVVLPIIYWGEKYYPIEGGSEYVIEHATCGHEFTPIPHVECSACAEPVALDALRLYPRSEATAAAAPTSSKDLPRREA